MAPVASSSAGVPTQPIDDPDLRALMSRLTELAPLRPHEEQLGTAPSPLASSAANSSLTSSRYDQVRVDDLVSELTKYPKWRFQEQVSSGWPPRSFLVWGVGK